MRIYDLDLPLGTEGKPRRAHLIGVCGSGMKALAEFLLDAGWHLSGSDRQVPGPGVRSLVSRGLKFYRGHDARHVPSDADLVVYSPAVDEENCERQAAASQGIPQLSYAEVLGLLSQEHQAICVAGTHGKSSTTAMTAWLLQFAGLSPSAIVGAELVGSGLSGWAGHGTHFVVESCEYRRSFLNLQPYFGAVLGIEADHFDCFETEVQLVKAFEEFAQQVPRDGLLLLRADCAHCRRLAQVSSAPIETFSLDLDSRPNWWAADLRRMEGGGYRFRVFYDGEYFAELALPLPGRHNVLNALAATALAFHAGVEPAEIREGLVTFPGVRRRFQVVGTWRGIIFVDDYAHHPTAVRAALQTAKECFGQRRIWCVFQPHQLSRLSRLMDEFAASFDDADHVLVTPVFAARERVSCQVGALASELAEKISLRGLSARYVSSLDQAITTLEDETLPGDVVIAIGAGDITRVTHEFTGRIQRHPAEESAACTLNVA